MAAVGIWKESFRVRSYETDPIGRASVATICNYLQEAAGNHAFHLGVSVEQLHQQQLTWVLAKLRVYVDEYPRWRGEVTLETWPSGIEGLFGTRDFLLLDSSGRRLARATSGWMMIDLERRRPVRMPELITSLETPDRSRAVADLSASLAEPACISASESERGSIRVRYGDLDVNGHVNNVRYVDWALEPLAVDLLESSELRQLEIHYRAEALLGDAVKVRVGAPEGAADDDMQFAHMILHAENGKELARLRTLWTLR